MNEKNITGQLHKMPEDLLKVINSASAIKGIWEDLTPLARNEWICWVISAKKPETRRQRIRRLKNELIEGKRRPCCWPGCPHRGNMNTARDLVESSTCMYEKNNTKKD